MTALAPTVEAFFTQRLAVQCDASPHTVAAYRDTLRLCWSSPATAPTHRPPGSTSATSTPRWSRRSSTHLQTERANSVSTRNARLTAIHSLFRHSALRHPEHAESIQRVLAIPAKRHQQKLVTAGRARQRHLVGRRDHALLTLAVQTGLRVSELTRLVRRDIHLGTGPFLGAARDARNARRRLPPTPSPRSPAGSANTTADQPILSPTRPGRPLSTDAVAWLLTKHAATAARRCPSLNDKHLTRMSCRFGFDAASLTVRSSCSRR